MNATQATVRDVAMMDVIGTASAFCGYVRTRIVQDQLPHLIAESGHVPHTAHRTYPTPEHQRTRKLRFSKNVNAVLGRAKFGGAFPGPSR